MNTASDFDDSEFYNYLLRNMPAPIVEMLRQHFLEDKLGLMSFERWLTNLPNNQEMMKLLFDLYEFDQLGKQEKTAYKIRMTVFKQKKQPNPFNDEFFEKLNKYLVSSSDNSDTLKA